MESLPIIVAMQRLIGGERHKFMTLDENATMKEIMETHILDGQEINVKSILQIVEDTFCSATLTIKEINYIPTTPELQIDLKFSIYVAFVVGLIL